MERKELYEQLQANPMLAFGPATPLHISIILLGATNLSKADILELCVEIAQKHPDRNFTYKQIVIACHDADWTVSALAESAKAIGWDYPLIVAVINAVAWDKTACTLVEILLKQEHQKLTGEMVDCFDYPPTDIIPE